MPFTVRCAEGHKLNVPSRYAGRTVRCPACNGLVKIPGNAPANAAPEAPAAETLPPAGKAELAPEPPAAEPLAAAKTKTAKPSETKSTARKPAAGRVKESPREQKVAAKESPRAVSPVPVEVAPLETTQPKTPHPGLTPVPPAPPSISASQSISNSPTPSSPPEVAEAPAEQPATTAAATRATPPPPPSLPPAAPSPVPEAGLPARKLGRFSWRRLWEESRERKLVVADPGYVADRTRRHSVYWLAGAQCTLALFSVLPVMMQWTNDVAAPWAGWVMGLALLQMVYAIWLCLSPDWSTAQVAMFSSGLLAAIYSAATAVCWLTAPRAGGWLQIGTLKSLHGNKPALWCAAVVLLASLVAYLCGHVSYRWRKAYRSIVLAGR